MLRGMWDPPGPGLEPMSPALAGRLPTTEDGNYYYLHFTDEEIEAQKQ